VSRKTTQEEFEKKVKELGEGKYKVIGKYINNKEKVKILHLECNRTYFVSPVKFYAGRRCSHCFKNKRKTTEEFYSEVKELGKGEYELVGKYNGNNKHCKIKHLNCGSIYNVTPANFIQGYRCPECSHNKRKTTEQFKEEVRTLTNNEYELIGIYKNNKTKTEILHKKCNSVFLMRPNDFITGHRCPICATLPHDSIGIRKIKKWLDKNEFYYEEEYSFPDCKYKNKLLFDFCLFDENDRPVLLIEYDGKQHFQPTFGNEKKFKEQQIRDKIKNEYCSKNGLKLIRINYKQLEQIEDILEENIN
jgi:hypothetical protein